MRYTYKIFEIQSSGTSSQHSATVRGSSVLCLAAEERVAISLDEGPWLPLEGGTRITPTNLDGSSQSFERIRVSNWAAAGMGGSNITANTVEIVVGDLEYETGKVGMYSGAEVRETPADLMTCLDVVTTGGNDSLSPQSVLTKMVNVRNTSATVTVRIATNATELTGGLGYQLLPGENVDLPVRDQLLVRGTAGVTLIVSRFWYNQ